MIWSLESGLGSITHRRYVKMRAVAMNLVRIVRESASASKVWGAALLVLSAGAGYGVYLAAAPDEAPIATSGDAVTIPPLVRAEPMSSPLGAVHMIPEAGSSPGAMPARSDRASLVRDLQAALTRAQCYDGPITGSWSARSKEAMRGFIVAVNAQLPVDDPDQALLALVQSNEAARCSAGRPISTGALGSPSSPKPEPPQRAQPLQAEITPLQSAHDSSEARTPVDDRPMIERPWAPAEMLIPPKNKTPPPAAVVPLTVGTAEPSTQPEVQPPSATASAPPSEQVIHFEGSKAEADPQPDASVPAPPPLNVTPAKSKSAKRKRAHDDDVSTSISKSFKSIQRSFSSMFE